MQGDCFGAKALCLEDVNLVDEVTGLLQHWACCCAGHDRELEQMKGAALEVGNAAVSHARGFVKGIQQGFDEHRGR